jgi:hypothetical protein
MEFFVMTFSKHPISSRAPSAGVRLKVGEKKWWSGLEFRNPNPEPRNPKEIRNPNAALEPFQLNSQSDLRKTA